MAYHHAVAKRHHAVAAHHEPQAECGRHEREEERQHYQRARREHAERAQPRERRAQHRHKQHHDGERARQHDGHHVRVVVAVVPLRHAGICHALVHQGKNGQGDHHEAQGEPAHAASLPTPRRHARHRMPFIPIALPLVPDIDPLQDRRTTAARTPRSGMRAAWHRLRRTRRPAAPTVPRTVRRTTPGARRTSRRGAPAGPPSAPGCARAQTPARSGTSSRPSRCWGTAARGS